jgi:hypothetical protein
MMNSYFFLAYFLDAENLMFDSIEIASAGF